MNIGTLSIEIATNVARLQKDMAEVKRSVGDTMREVETVVSFAKVGIVGLIGVGSVNAFAGMIQGAIEGRARLYDVSLQTGIAVEQLASLGKVAKYSDTQLADVASASNKLSKALATQNEDSKGAAQALAALGLNFQQFKAMSPDRQLLAVAQAMGQFSDATGGKAAAAMLLFGKTGASLLPFLAELNERGLQATKATTESAKAAKEYEDNIIALKAAQKEWQQQLVNDITPALVAFTSKLVDSRQAFGGWIAALQAPLGGGSGTASQLAAVRARIEEIQTALAKPGPQSGGILSWLNEGAATRLQQELKSQQQTLAYLKAQQQRDALAAGGSELDEPRFRKKPLNLALPAPAAVAERDTYTPLINAIDQKLAAQQAELDLGRKLTDAERYRVEVLQKLADGTVKATYLEQLNAQVLLGVMVSRERESKAIEEQNKWLDESNRLNDQALAAASQRSASLQQELAGWDEQLRTFGMTRDQLQALASERDRETAAQLRARKVADDFNPTLAAMNAELERQAKALDDIAAARDALEARRRREEEDPAAGAGRAVQGYLDEVRRAGDATQEVLGRSLRGAEDQLTQLFTQGKLSARSFVDTLIQEFIRLRVVKPLLADIFGGGSGFQAWFSQTGAGGNGFGTGAAYGNQDFAGFFAQGGYIPPGQWGIAGEQGPERIYGGRTGATVQPTAQGLTLAPTTHVHIDSRSDTAQVQQLVMEGVAQGNRQLVEVLKANGRLN